MEAAVDGATVLVGAVRHRGHGLFAFGRGRSLGLVDLDPGGVILYNISMRQSIEGVGFAEDLCVSLCIVLSQIFFTVNGVRIAIYE